MAIIKTHFFNISFEHKDLMKMLIKMTEYQDEMFPQDSKKIANNVKGVSVMDEANPYNEPLDNIYHILNRLNLESNVQDNEFKEINLHNANKLIDDINDKIDNIVKIKEDITKEKEENDEAIILLKNLEESKISVDDVKNTKYIGYKVVNYTKTDNADRWIVLTDRAKKLIAKIREVNKETFEVYEDFLFVQHGYLIEPTRLYNFIKSVCKCINIPVKGTHKIRKTYGSTIYEKTKDVSLVKEALGHADERTTYKHYIFRTDSREERQQKILNALQGNTTSSEKCAENVRQCEMNIIPFPINKKVENLHKQKVFHQ